MLSLLHLDKRGTMHDVTRSYATSRYMLVVNRSSPRPLPSVSADPPAASTSYPVTAPRTVNPYRPPVFSSPLPP